MTHTDYSKPSGDITIEAQSWKERDELLLSRQRKVSHHLQKGLPREHCLLCAHSLDNSSAYQHRNVTYLFCTHCGHLQTRNQLPVDYPYAYSGSGFEDIYPPLDKSAYLSRRERIYAPKLDWILSRVDAAGHSVQSAINATWLELGCGAGYFLHALQARGIHNVTGLDGNASLVAEANHHCESEVAQLSCSILDDLDASSADIITAFFVLEHIEAAADFWRILSNKRSGTLFAFSVPSFGLSTITEGALDGFAARNLDNVVHTQLYTDRSIDYALEQAGYRKVAEWLFGQDAQDLLHLLLHQITPHMDAALAEKTVQQLTALVDPLQQAIDHARLCDARHVLAVRC